MYLGIAKLIHDIWSYICNYNFKSRRSNYKQGRNQVILAYLVKKAESSPIYKMSKPNRRSVNMSLKDHHDNWRYYFAMLYHKTIYNHASWNEHRSNFRHGYHLMRIVGFPLWPPIMILTMYSVFVACYNEAVLHHSKWRINLMHVSSSPLTFTAAALIVLLGFRTTACYGRFDEARKTWGGNLNRCRDLARQACTWMNTKEDEKTQQYFIQYLKAIHIV